MRIKSFSTKSGIGVNHEEITVRMNKEFLDGLRCVAGYYGKTVEEVIVVLVRVCVKTFMQQEFD